MSRTFVRDKIKDFITTNFPGEKLCDMTAEFRDLEDFLEDNGVTRNDPWLGIQFIGNEEEPITIPATNQRGKYRELGVVFLHVVDVAKVGVGQDIQARVEALRDAFRGQNIDGIKILSTPPGNFESGATLQFDSGWTSASLPIDYEHDLDL